jgi:hypothetical protein
MKNTKRIIVMNTDYDEHNVIERAIYYISGIVVLVSGFMIFHTWGESTGGTIAWTLALLGWLPDFIFGSVNNPEPEE